MHWTGLNEASGIVEKMLPVIIIITNIYFGPIALSINRTLRYRQCERYYVLTVLEINCITSFVQATHLHKNSTALLQLVENLTK